MGGWIAIEMANQLQVQGKRVALVVLLDTGAKSLPFMSLTQKLSERIWSFSERVKYHARKMFFSSLSIRQEHLHNIAIQYKKRKDYRKWGLRLVDREIDQVQIPEYLRDIRKANEIAANDYDFKLNLRKFSGKVVYFRAKDREIDRGGYFGWENYARNIEIQDVPGDHVTLLAEPHVQVLAKKLQASIDQAIGEE